MFLHEAGFSYAATDITQAFYLQQNHMWTGLYPEEVVECVTDEVRPVRGRNIVHIPYWKLWEYKDMDLSVDIIMSNHALAEMHERSLKFYLEFGKHIMKTSKIRVFVAQATGAQMKRSWNFVASAFEDAGYRLLYDNGEYRIFRLNDIPKERKDETGFFHDSEDSVISSIKRIIPEPAKEKLHKMKVEISEQVKAKKRISGTKNQLASYIDEKERKLSAEGKVGYKEIRNFFKNVSSNYDTPDEEFVHYIGLESL